MERRKYKNREFISIIGFGGVSIMDEEQEFANKLVAEVIDRGINYFDVAPSYGNAEERLGPALRGKREKIFLACKTQERTKDGAWRELHESLKRLETDYFDLYQLHAMTTEEDFEKAMGPNGAMETFLKAKEEGIIRYIGFSAHSVKIALKLLDAFNFDSILFPMNWVLYFNEDFGPQVVERAREKGTSILAIKPFAKTLVSEGQESPYNKCWYIPVDDKDLAELALRFTLSQPIVSAIPPGEYKFLMWALEIAENFKSITGEEIKYLREKAKDIVPIFKLEV